MNQELINKEKKQLLLFSKFKKIGILCLSIGGLLIYMKATGKIVKENNC